MMNAISHTKKTREPEFAGQFYPADKAELENTIKTMLAEAAAGFDCLSGMCNRLRALISPHAGYVYSGKTAAAAFSQISENANYKRIFVLASSHRYSFDGAAVFTGNYKTPLGEITTDIDVMTQLKQHPGIFLQQDEAHYYEHGIEVQLPFLQYKLQSEFQLVPLVLGTQRPETCKKIAQTLKPWFTPENLFVVSTDFSHYPDYEDARQIDFLTAANICKNKPKKLIRTLEDNQHYGIRNLATSLCGWTSVLTLLYLTEHEDFKYHKIAYQNSGDSENYGEKDRVVGYWAIGILDRCESLLLAAAEKNELLSRARSAIKEFVQTGKHNILSGELKGILNEKTGAFVSIYINNELRGCIGSFAKNKTLNELVQESAASAACDERFTPPSKDELDKMELEISVLSPLTEIKTPDEIIVGKHGIYIRRGNHSGTLLPQVATKRGWSVEEFLGHCARDKAGIGWEGWKTAEIYTYEAAVFRG